MKACVVGFAAIAALVASCSAQSSFRVLELPAGVLALQVNGVSRDGSTVVGLAFLTTGDQVAFRWSQGAGVALLEDLAEGGVRASALCADETGVRVGGTAAGPGTYPQPVRWDAPSPAPVIVAPQDDLLAGVYDMSVDGSVMVGRAAARAFRASPAGVHYLPALITGLPASIASGCSADGAVVVGTASNGPTGTQFAPFRWTAAGGTVSLGDLPGGIESGGAYDCSADGSVVVGSSISGDGREPFRWTASTGMVGLGSIPEGPIDGSAQATSGDGSLIVGETHAAGGDQVAFLWSAALGMRPLREALLLEGVIAVEAWSPTLAVDISADGATMVGHATLIGSNPVVSRAFVAVLRPAPCVLDVNQDGNEDQDDVAALIDIIGGGANPWGAPPDFNHDGNADQDDVRGLLNAIAGVGCP